MADTMSHVEKFWRSETEAEALRFLNNVDSSAPEAKAVADNAEALRKMLTSESDDRRIKIANAFIEDAKSDFGMAHAVLARESSDLVEKEKHYRSAQENSKDHVFNSKGDFPAKADALHAAITLEFADVLWRMSKPTAAIDVLKTLHSNSDLWKGQLWMDRTVSALAVYLICEGKDKEARALLDEDPVPTAEWHYLNALLTFRASGDCVQSRSAASAALSDSLLVAIELTETDAEIAAQEEEAAATDSDVDYARVTKPAWQSTAGALPWLSNHMENEPRLFGAEKQPDELRFKKWQREFELAETHLRRKDFKAMKRSLRSALREADVLNDGGDMFILTAQTLGTLLEEMGDSLEELQGVFDKKIVWLDRQEREDIHGLFTSYAEYAKVLMEMGMLERAENCAETAVTLFEKSIDQGTGKLNLHDGAGCLLPYACMLSQQKKFAEAERRFSQLTAIQEEYLGKRHLSLVEGMMGWRYCLHQLNRHEEEKLIYDRLYSIDENFDAGDEYQFVCDAALVKTE